MVPERIVENSILHEIKRWSEIIIQKKDLCPNTDKQKWEYSDFSDWSYGHFIGMIEGLAVLYHHVTHHRQITPQELRDIEDFIAQNTKDIKNYFYSQK